MIEPPVPPSQETWAKLADEVREASKSGKLTRLADVWSGTEEEYLGLEPDRTSDLADIVLIREGGDVFLFSDVHMTQQYARTAALAVSGDVLQLIAETVRSDSATYPRPTSIESFQLEPFRLSMDTLAAALDEMADDTRYQDVQSVSASDGSRFLFSAHSLEPAHARSLAEWTAVGQFDNP